MTLAAHNTRFKLLRRKAPQIIGASIIIILAIYVSFEFLEDVLIEGTPITSGPLISAIISFTSNVKDTVTSWGYPGIFGLMILESSSLPVPSEVVLPFSGYLVSIGQLDIWVTVVVATFAAIAGSMVDYYVGLKGIEVLTKRRVLGRVLFSMDQLMFADQWFNKYGGLAIFLARLVPGIRTLISFPAGAAKMPLPKFLAYTTAGCILWNSLLIYVGFYLGSNWTEVASFSHYVLIGVVLGLAVIVSVYMVMWRRKRKMRKAEIKSV
jgi:membrane protein DedA with SNARE-associated domain